MEGKSRRTAPWKARFDGFVKLRKTQRHNPYSILAAKRSESKAYACALAVPWLAARPIAHTAKSPVTLDDCKTEKYNRIANEFNILI